MSKLIVNVRKTSDYDVYIGREVVNEYYDLPCSKWHNPFKSKDYPNCDVLYMYENYIISSELYDQLEELDGLVLGCWCKPNKCHGDVLIKLLNEKKM
jgi:hypothetical protein